MAPPLSGSFLSSRQLLTTAALLLPTITLAVESSSSKRGLVFIPNEDHPEDNQIWVQPESGMAWYYHYGMQPASAYDNLTQEQFEFVPMFWGPPSEDDEAEFYATVSDLITVDSRNVTHLLGFNEPDAPADWGGSNMEPKEAARHWAKNMEPLKEDFPWLRLGLPACTAVPGWVDWLGNFLDECAEIVHDGDRNCSFDFLPLHFYGNFEGLASYMGTAREFFPDVPLWVTEYAYANQDLQPTQDFYQASAEYFDRLDFVERYSYFGAFRSGVSNVGPNVAFLNNDGELTDIGSWYMGGEATGVDPQSVAPRLRIEARTILACLFAVAVGATL